MLCIEKELGKFFFFVLVIKCPRPLIPDGGAVHFDDTSAGSMAYYQCDEDKVLVGHGTNRCNEMGEWDVMPPNCIAHEQSGNTIGTCTCEIPVELTILQQVVRPETFPNTP
jgi:hypothetical protein